MSNNVSVFDPSVAAPPADSSEWKRLITTIGHSEKLCQYRNFLCDAYAEIECGSFALNLYNPSKSIDWYLSLYNLVPWCRKHPFLPIARTNMGDIIVIKLRDGMVYLLDHEPGWGEETSAFPTRRTATAFATDIVNRCVELARLISPLR
jgi:hypothetical protein